MAAPSSTSSINYGTSESQQYPYPSHVNAASFLSIKLSGKPNYVRWKEQMLCLVDSHDVLGFIDGTIKKPLEYNGSKTKLDMPAFEAKCREWKRSDMLVKGWIFGSLSEGVMGTVVGLQTAQEVWNKLKANYTTPPPAPAPVVSTTNTATRKKEYGEHIPLYRAVKTGDWKKAVEFFNEDKDALTDKLNSYGGTALHVAIGNQGNIGFVENLLEQIDPESLPSLVNKRQENALHHAAQVDNCLGAEKLVEKNPYLLFTVEERQFLPVKIAAISSHKTTFLYLLKMCKQHVWRISQKEGYHNPFEGEKGVSLLNETILAGFLDVAYDLLKDHPELARTKVGNPKVPKPLWCIAKKWNAFPSAEQYNFYQRFIYSHVPTENALPHAYKIKDIENQETCGANPVTKCTKSYVYPVIERIIVKFWKVALLHVPHIKHLHEDKTKHNFALLVLRFICEEVAKLKSDHYNYYGDAFIVAVRNNTQEIIEQITRTFPQSIWTGDINGYKFAQLSIMHRCENAYNFLVHEVAHDKHLHLVTRDKDDNNLYHLAGQLAPTHKLNMVTGAALQMQRELQWFQEVAKLVRPKDREFVNKKEETPIMVFRKEHKDLRQQGEEWMKKTADSYTITAALIITIVFAAAITVPGGNNGDTGKPIYETRLSFIIFAVSDAISLFTSTTSLLLFLSILTARFAEEDFLYRLPKRLILGLVMLFMSVTSMMIAFSATLYMMFGLEKSWVLIPIAALTCLPVASFVTLQLPLLVDLIFSTYGPGIFGKNSELRITS